MMITKYTKITPFKESDGQMKYAKEETTYGEETQVRYSYSDSKEFAYLQLEILHGRINGSISANNGSVRVETMTTEIIRK